MSELHSSSTGKGDLIAVAEHGAAGPLVYEAGMLLVDFGVFAYNEAREAYQKHEEKLARQASQPPLEEPKPGASENMFARLKGMFSSEEAEVDRTHVPRG